jgi:diguanylate cyclase (GGDEF)-like protein/PAS domain S-box-containing protein
MHDPRADAPPEPSRSAHDADGWAQPIEVEDNPWRLALEGAGGGIWDWDLVANTQTHSRQWEVLLGYSGTELNGGYEEFLALVHPDDIARVETALNAYLDGTAPVYDVEMRMRCKKGAWSWIVSRGLVVRRDAQGKPQRMLGTHTDINALKKSAADLHDLNTRLQENTNLLQATLTSISQGIIVFDANLRVRRFNPRACELLEVPSAFLATHPTLQELGAFQRERGDFGDGGVLVQSHAREHVQSDGQLGDIPNAYLRQTRAGTTLEIKTQILPDGGMVRTFADVTDYVHAEEERLRLDQLLDAMQSLAEVGGWEVDAIADKVFWTDGVYRIFETSPQEYTPTTAMETAERFFTPSSMARIRESYFGTETPGDSHDLEMQAVTARGKPIWVHSKGNSVRHDGRLISRTSVLQNITERKLAQAALQESENLWKLAMDSTGDGVWDWDISTDVENYSRRLLEMYGFEQGELEERITTLDERTHPDDLERMVSDRRAHFEGLTPTYYNEHRVRCKDGSWKWVLSRGMVISRDANDQPLRMIGTHTDITERKNSEALILQQAFFDTLTGLPNRRMLHDRLEQEIKKSRRDAQLLAILFIDLDHFKEVNDTLGHGNGDLLLVEAAHRLRNCVRESDTVARMGGDEFTVLVTDLDEAKSLEPLLQKILASLEQVFKLGGEQVFVSASIGVTLYPVDGHEIEDLLKNADQALYVAKGAGRNRYSFFTAALQEAAQTRARLAHDLRNGLAEQQFRMVYQPIIDMATGDIHKAEALIRWQHPTRGLISPAEFIPIAEASGLIVDIGEWVFQQAARQVQVWRSTLHPDFQISINKSPVQFQHDSADRDSWAHQLSALGLPGNSIVVEITEGLLLDTSSSVVTRLLDLGSAGIQVSLDDFGTGYSSLSYLQKFDLDYLKIDQSFVRYLIPNSTDLALCKAIIVMAHALGMKVIAEGVETEQHRDLLAEAGCDYGQGYWFARPMTADDFTTFARRSSARG